MSLLKHFLFFSTLIPIVTLANSQILNGQYSIGLDLGLTKPTHIGNSVTFPAGYSTFSYSSNRNDVTSIISGISISKIFTITPLYSLQVGASAHYISNMDVNGNLQQGISPPFYQAGYSYSINSYQYLAEAKLRQQFYPRYFPYIYFGLGFASNKAHGYATTVPAYLTVTPQYSNNTSNSFTYSLGLGLDYLVLPQLSVGFGYRFMNLGKVGLASGVIQTTNVGTRLTQTNLYMNTLFAQLNYFFT